MKKPKCEHCANPKISYQMVAVRKRIGGDQRIWFCEYACLKAYRLKLLADMKEQKALLARINSELRKGEW